MEDQQLAHRDMRLLWNGVVYLIALLYFGIAWWKTLIVCFFILVSISLRYGGRWFERLGFMLLLTAGAVWLQVVPPPEQWLIYSKMVLQHFGLTVPAI